MRYGKMYPVMREKYQVSSCGRVKGIDYYVREKSGKERLHTGRMLKTFIVNGGYHCLKLQVQNKRKSFLVHRLVAMAFIPNPNGYDTVNHKDENKNNNSVENLEWLPLYQNNRYGNHDAKMRLKLSKPVKQYTQDGVLIREYESVASVKNYGFNPAGVSKVAKGDLKTHKGYIWKY